MPYHLWLNFQQQEIETYYSGFDPLSAKDHFGDEVNIAPIYLDIDSIFCAIGKSPEKPYAPKNVFTLPEIDFLTCSFANYGELARALENDSLCDHIMNAYKGPRQLTIAKFESDKKAQAVLKRKVRYGHSVIYNSSFLKSFAAELCGKPEGTLLPWSVELNSFVEQFAESVYHNESLLASVRKSTMLSDEIKAGFEAYVLGRETSNPSKAISNLKTLYGECRNYEVLRTFVSLEQEYQISIAPKRPGRAGKQRLWSNVSPNVNYDVVRTDNAGAVAETFYARGGELGSLPQSEQIPYITTLGTKTFDDAASTYNDLGRGKKK